MSVDSLIEGVIGREGGYVNDPNDAGGATKWGITERVARANGYKGSMRDLPRETAKDIYFEQYVKKPGFSALIPVSEAIAEEVIDTGVNMGPAKAAEFLQKALNALNNQGKDYPDIVEDGDIGPATVKALFAFLAKRGREGESVLLKMLNGLQVARYVEIARTRAPNESFMFGWIRSRVS